MNELLYLLIIGYLALLFIFFRQTNKPYSVRKTDPSIDGNVRYHNPIIPKQPEIDNWQVEDNQDVSNNQEKNVSEFPGGLQISRGTSKSKEGIHPNSEVHNPR